MCFPLSSDCVPEKAWIKARGWGGGRRRRVWGGRNGFASFQLSTKNRFDISRFLFFMWLRIFIDCLTGRWRGWGWGWWRRRRRRRGWGWWRWRIGLGKTFSSVSLNLSISLDSFLGLALAVSLSISFSFFFFFFLFLSPLCLLSVLPFSPSLYFLVFFPVSHLLLMEQGEEEEDEEDEDEDDEEEEEEEEPRLKYQRLGARCSYSFDFFAINQHEQWKFFNL